MDKNNIKFSDIVAAKSTIAEVIRETSLMPSNLFSQMSGANISLKLENLQTTGSFKVRGSYNKIKNLTKEELAKGVVAASAGNHAQGVAFSATRLGIKSTIFMPVFTPPLKVMATRGYGANVILAGNSFDDAYAASQEYCKEHSAIYIHPFDDPHIIAGQGTVGLEIFSQAPNTDTVVVPIGGGGLIAGIAIAIKEMNPNIKIIGVEAEGAASMYTSRKNKKVTKITSASTIADGIAVKVPGEITYNLVQKYVDDIVVVSDAEIAHTTYQLLQRSKLLAEPSGVASIAAAIFQKFDVKGKNVACVVSGGNINMHLLGQIIEKGMLKERLRARICTIIPDQSGELAKIIQILVEMNANIFDVEHIRSAASVQIGKVMIAITLDLQEQSQLPIILDRLEKHGLSCQVMN